MSPAKRARLIKVGRRVYLTVLVMLLAGLVATKHDEVATLLIDTRPVPLAATLVASFGLIAIGAGFWAVALHQLGHSTPLREIVLATTRALPARYLPLGVSFAIARGGLLRAAGVGIGPLAATAMLEMSFSVTVALAAGTAILGAVGNLPGGIAWTAAVIPVALLIMSPPICGRFLHWLAKRREAMGEFTWTWNGWLRLLAVSGAYWGWASTTFVLYLRAFPAADDFGSIETAGAFMIAWAVGFLTVFAPQGLGVAEIGLVALLAIDENSSIAFTVIFVGYRFVQMARDALGAAAAEIIATRRARPGSVPTD